jgi:hypothetical protein
LTQLSFFHIGKFLSKAKESKFETLLLKNKFKALNIFDFQESFDQEITFKSFKSYINDDSSSLVQEKDLKFFISIFSINFILIILKN